MLPPNAVRLQPVAIGPKAVRLGTSGALKWGESTPDALEEKPGIEYPPTVLYVDLFTYVHPYHRLGNPTSFGKFIAPLITVRTAPAAAPETLGGLVTPSAFVPYTRQPAREAGAANGLGVSFVDYLNATAGVPPDHFPIPTKRFVEHLPIMPGNYLVLPVTQFEVAETSSQRPAGTQRASQLPEQAIFDAYRDIIVSALNVIPYDKATRAARGQYIARYDRALAQRWTAGAELSRLEREKVAVIRQFEQTEWEFLGRQDEEFIERVFYGQWGDFMRQARAAEENFRVNYAKEKSRRDTEMMLRTVSMSMQSLANTQSATTSADRLQASMHFQQQALGMLAENRQHQSDLTNASMTFNNHMHSILRQKTSFVFTLAGKTLDIHARSLEELRAEMRRLYLQIVRKSAES